MEYHVIYLNSFHALCKESFQSFPEAKDFAENVFDYIIVKGAIVKGSDRLGYYVTSRI